MPAAEWAAFSSLFHHATGTGIHDVSCVQADYDAILAEMTHKDLCVQCVTNPDWLWQPDLVTTVVVASPGTTATHGVFRDLCTLGLTSVHFRKQCQQNVEVLKDDADRAVVSLNFLNAVASQNTSQIAEQLQKVRLQVVLSLGV
mmetsp:Transcript_22561/g.53365  ORF Transcript_22561/g.53365 Transcript_22561/m.53365 type:complete len:144 (-) Transcript_22561:258-689(-)